MAKDFRGNLIFKLQSEFTLNDVIDSQESVQGHNATFLSMLPPELAAKAQPVGAYLAPATQGTDKSSRDYSDGRSSPLPRDVSMLNISTA